MSFVKNKLFVAIVLNLLCLFANVLFVSNRFSSLDDFFMASILSGACDGELNVHLYFVKVIYGYVLFPLYSLFPGVGWYGVFEHAAIFVSFTTITYVILKKLGHKVGGAFAALLLCCVSISFYFSVAFTQCAAALTAAGILVFCFGYTEKRNSLFFFGSFLMIWGFVMRSHMFLLGMPTCIALLLFVLWRTRKIYVGAIVALLLCFAVVGGLNEFDKRHYQSGGYERYAAYQGPRSFFGDGAFYDAEALVDELDERGMSSYDYQMLRAWYFNDNEVFSLDSLYAIMNIANRNRYDANYVFAPVAVLKTLSEKISSPNFWCWALLCFSLIFFSNKRAGLIPWASLLILGISYEYLILQHRIVGHVESGIWLYACIVPILFLDKEDILAKKQWLSFLQILGLVSAVSVFLTSVNIAYDLKNRTSDDANEKSDWALFMDYAKANRNDVFLLPYEKYKALASEIGRPFKATPARSWQNIYSTGYWNFNLPSIEKEMEKRGVTNMFKDIKKENVYVMADEFISFIPFYEHHYHETLVADTVKTFGSLVLLKYREVE